MRLNVIFFIVIISLSERESLSKSQVATVHLINNIGDYSIYSPDCVKAWGIQLPREVMQWARKNRQVAVEETPNRIVAPFRVVQAHWLPSLRPHFPHL